MHGRQATCAIDRIYQEHLAKLGKRRDPATQDD